MPLPAFEILHKHQARIEELCKEYGVQRLRVFGSAVREDWDSDRSDIDFLADFGPAPIRIDLAEQQLGLLVKLEELLGRKVDLVDWNAARKPGFRERAESQALEFYAA